MNNRKIEQIGSPMEIYSRPASRFVATFVGSPTMNFLNVGLSEHNGFISARLPDGTELQTAIRAAGIGAGEYALGIRAEAVKIANGVPATTTGKVDVLERLGDRTLLYTRLKDGSTVVAEDIGNSRVTIGDEVGLTLDGSRTHLFDGEGHAWHNEEAGHG
jgi:multiple sugar transport system ATP-binding protein